MPSNILGDTGQDARPDSDTRATMVEHRNPVNAASEAPDELTAAIHRDAARAKEAYEAQVQPGTDLVVPARPLQPVFQTRLRPEEHTFPHMQAPPYVHHFDTYTLVKNLNKGGFTEEQSTTLMKAVRGLLAVNLDVAKEGLVGKDDMENVRLRLLHDCSGAF